VIRWEQQEDGSWHGLSGEFVVATVTRDEGEQGQWLWTITALKRPKGWRKGAGHRTSVLEARGAADDYWNRWLEGAALRPDITRLALSRRTAHRRRRRAKAPLANARDIRRTPAVILMGEARGGLLWARYGVQ